MMRIRMLETRRGTEDGFTIRQYQQDQEYDMADGLAHAFIAAGFAVRVDVTGAAEKPTKKQRVKMPRKEKTTN